MMKSVLSLSLRPGLSAALRLLLTLASLVALPAQAERNMQLRYSTNANGEITLIGNAILTCPPGSTSTTAPNPSCEATLAGTNNAGARNDGFTMQYIDVDSDSGTFSSSSATLTIPAGSTVLFAGLYWSGISADVARSQVLLKTPTAFGYSQVNASVLDTSPFRTNSYQGFADITARVAAAGNGSYTVGNVLTTPGAGNYGAWGMVVVYRNDSLSLRNLAVYDSFLQLAGTSATIPVSGFLTPLSGPVNTRLGAITYEGDLPAVGDTFSINGTQLTDACNPTNNFYNATICDLGVTVTGRNPASVNNTVFDIDRINVPVGIVGNGATGATIQVSSPATTETFLLGVVTFSTELYVPIITPNIVKTGTDLNGGALVAGDTLRWRIYMKNTGLDSGTTLSLSDPIPANLTYKPGTLAITQGANAGSKTDASGDDQAEYLASGTPRVVFRLGTGANGSTGGTLAYNDATEITFDTTVNPGLAAGTPITNTASISYSGQTIPDQFAGSGAAANTVVLVPPTITKAFSPNVIDVGGAAQLIFVVSNPASNAGAVSGASFLDTYPAGLLNAATPNAQVNCTAGASGTLQGGAAGGNTIGLANATIPPNGNCTVSVVVTANAIGNYTNTSAALTTTNAGTGSTASATLSVGKPSIAKAFSPSSILAGSNSTLTFSLTNLAATPISGVSFSDPLVNMQVAATPGITNTCGGTVSAAAGASAISLTGATLPATSSCTVTVAVTSNTAGVHANTSSGVASTQTGAAGNPSNTALLTVIAPPVMTKSFAPSSVRTNVPTQLTLTVSNPNPSITVTGVAFTDSYPANMVNNTPASPTLNCTAGSTATRTGGADGGASIGLTAGSLAPGGSCTLTVNVEGTAVGSLVNSTGTVTSANTGAGAAASATLNITGLIAPTVAKAFGAASIPAGASTTLTITLTNPNTGAGNTITGVAFNDVYPAGLVNAAAPALSNSCGGTATAPGGSGSLSLSGGAIAPASSCTVVVTVTSSESGQYTNTTGTVTSANGGTFGPAIANLDVLSPPVLVKSFTPDAIASGGTSSLSLVISNPTTATTSLTGVAFTDVFPAGVTLANTTVSNTCTAGSTAGTLRDSGGGTLGAGDTGIRWNAGTGTLAPNGVCTITVNVTSTTAGTYTNTTNATSANGGTGASSSAVLTVGRPDLTKAFLTSPIAIGGSSVLRLTLRNPTGTVMSAAAVTDNYPTGLVNAATPAATTTCTAGGATPTVTAAAGGNSLSLTGGGIPANATCTVSVTVTATSNVVNTIPAGALTVAGGGSNGGPASATLLVYLQPTVAKSFADATIVPGTSTRMTIGVTNTNSINGTTLAFTDTFPAGLVVAATPASSNGCGGTLEGRTGAGAWGAIAAGNTAIRLTAGTVLANSSCQVAVNVTSNSAGSYTNSTGAVTTANIGEGAAATAHLEVMAAPTVTKSFSPASILVDEASLLTITLVNPNAAAVTGINFTDTYPAGLVNDSAPAPSSSCSGGTVTGSAGAGSVTLANASIAANGSCSVTVRVTSASAGSYANTLAAFATGNAGSTAAASATLTVSRPMPALVLDKQVVPEWDPLNLASNPKLIPGARALYSMRLSNTGPGTPDNNSVIVSDSLPLQIDLFVGDLGGAGSGPVQFTDGSPASGLVWNFVSLANMSDSLDFSQDGTNWNYVPVPDAQGFDASVRHLRFKPSGAMPAAAGGNPNATFIFRARLR